ncbi:MAG: hypothetical protein P8Q52_14690 [Acidimicrobiales bacterium]|nr:hypothetical protein [Acidimicrobiales bacterium]
MTKSLDGPFLFQAEDAAERGDLQAARELYEAIAVVGDARAWSKLGDLATAETLNQDSKESADGCRSEAIAFYRQGAEAGDRTAALRLADALHALGDDNALDWYCQAASLGLAEGALKAGRFLWEADHEHKDIEAVEQQWQRALAMGERLNALTALAELEIFRNDPVTAVGYAIRASLVARHQLLGSEHGEIGYEDLDAGSMTDDVARQFESALDLINNHRMETLAGAEAGDADACWNWGRIENLGFGQLPDPDEGQAWIERAAAAGQPEALLALSRRDRKIGNLAGFERQLRVAAAAGLPAASHDLGYALYSGAFDGTPDINAALEAYRSIAGPDHPTTATDLSFVLEDQPGPEAAAESVRWLLVAGEAGDVAAMRRLGERYLAGEGFDADVRKALAWFMSAHYAGWDDGLTTLQPIAKKVHASDIIAADRDADGSGQAAALLLDDQH